MREYSLEHISKDVRIVLDQNQVNEPLVDIGDIETLSMDDIIKSKVEEAVKRIHQDAPATLLDGAYNFGDSLYWGENCAGWVLLPDDFMRLVAFQMSDWSRPVFATIPTESPKYAMQSSRFSGVRGTAQKPVCAIVPYAEGKALEFYSCKSEDAQVKLATYLPNPMLRDIDGEWCIEICEKCYKSVVYMIGALVATAYSETDKCNLLTELSKATLI
jgi:hypothetical protein